MFLYIFGLRLSRGSRGLSLRLRFKVRVKVKVKVKVKGVKVYICPINKSIVLRYCR